MEEGIIAIYQVIKVVREILNVLMEMEIEATEKTVIYNDNTSALAVISGSKTHRRSKHIEIKYMSSREEIGKGDIELKYVKTEDNLVDGTTECLHGVFFNKMVDTLITSKEECCKVEDICPYGATNR